MRVAQSVRAAYLKCFLLKEINRNDLFLAVNPRVVGSSPTPHPFMVLVAERFRRRIVVPVYVGSNPTKHPIYWAMV